MAEDLDRYVKRFAIAARRAGPIRRAITWARRHPALALALTAAFLACMVAVFFANPSRLSERSLASRGSRPGRFVTAPSRLAKPSKRPDDQGRPVFAVSLNRVSYLRTR